MTNYEVKQTINKYLKVLSVNAITGVQSLLFGLPRLDQGQPGEHEHQGGQGKG